MKLIEYSFAKINLFLDILSPRPDGYHDLQTIMSPLDWCDLVILEGLQDARELWSTTDNILADMSLAELSIGKAIEKMRKYRKHSRGFSLHLIKNVPYNAGLGIASSNAVSVLKILNRYWKCGLTKEQLLRISEEIGSDCPFFFHQEICEVMGRGENIRILGKKPGRYPLGVFKPLEGGISTAWAFECVRKQNFYAKYREQGLEFVNMLTDEISWDKLSLCCCNSFFELLEPGEPFLRAAYNTLKTEENIVQMTGSGSSFFVIFPNHKSWQKFWFSKQKKLKNNFDFYWTIL